MQTANHHKTASWSNKMSAKTVNYTPEQTIELVEAYKANPTKETVEAFAVKFAKTARSIVAKLSREGVYQKAEYTTKAGEKPIGKEEIATTIGEFLKLDEASASSLAKANKKALAAIAALCVETANLRAFKAEAMEGEAF